jgi:hypothetical protein
MNIEYRDKYLEVLYNKLYDASHVIAQYKANFDKFVEAKYGFHYSDLDMDTIIDSLDYGTANMTFAEFDKLMKQKKQEINGTKIS